MTHLHVIFETSKADDDRFITTVLTSGGALLSQEISQSRKQFDIR